MRYYVVPLLGDVGIGDLTPSHVVNLAVLACVRLKPATVALLLRCLRAMLSAAMDEAAVDRNVASKIVRRLRLRTETNSRALTGRELRRLLSVPDRHHLLWSLLAYSGLRVGEALGLTWADLDLHRRLLTVRLSKNGRGRVVEIPGCLVRCLTKERGPWKGVNTGSPLFPGQASGHLGTRCVRKAFKTAAQEAGLARQLSPHCLRHTYASLLVSAGAPLEWVRRQLGHSSIRLTADLYGCHLPMDGRRWLRSLPRR
jgi:integrase